MKLTPRQIALSGITSKYSRTIALKGFNIEFNKEDVDSWIYKAITKHSVYKAISTPLITKSISSINLLKQVTALSTTREVSSSYIIKAIESINVLKPFIKRYANKEK